MWRAIRSTVSRQIDHEEFLFYLSITLRRKLTNTVPKLLKYDNELRSETGFNLLRSLRFEVCTHPCSVTDDKFWKFDPSATPPVKKTYPKPISNWDGIPNKLDAALQYTNGYTYFFKKGAYWRFNDRNFMVRTDLRLYRSSNVIYS